MKLTTSREVLLAAFQTAAAVAPSRSPKTILQNVKFEVGEGLGVLTATDLEIGVRVQVADLDAQAPGSAVLHVGRFGSILRESSDPQLRIESDGQATVVRGERSEFRLPSENPAEFPAVAEFQESRYHELPARALRELVRRTIFATDNESSRYALGGVLLEMEPERIIGVATDGRRLAKMEVAAQSVGGHGTGESTTIVPAKALQLIERSLGDPEALVRLAARGNDVLLQCGGLTVYSRLVEGRFPRWRDVFPQRTGAARIELVVGPLLSAVRQAAIVTDNDSRGVDFAFQAGSLVLQARAAGTGQSRVELPVAYDGPPLGVTLDPRFVADFLKVLDLERTFTLEVGQSDAAAVASTDDGYGYVIMPLARDRQS
jgi:DNA polymerase-3 subunit beta